MPDNESQPVAADVIGSLLAGKPAAVLGLATGYSPLAIYDELTNRCADGAVSFARAKGLTLDEYVGLPADHPESYRNVPTKEFISRVDFPPGAVIGDELGNFVHRLDARVVMSTIAVVHGDLALTRDIVAVAQDELGAKDAVHAPGMILARARIAAAELDFDEGVRLPKPLLANDSTPRTYWPRLLDEMRLSAGIAVTAGDRTFAGRRWSARPAPLDAIPESSAFGGRPSGPRFRPGRPRKP